MIKRIVVGLDGSPNSDTAVALACALTKRHEAKLVGVAVVDLPGIERSESAARAGAGTFTEKARDHLVAEARVRTARLVEAFEAGCGRHDVRSEFVQDEGHPHECLARRARAADIVVVGVRTFFHHETREGQGDTLRRLITDAVCPILAVPEGVELPRQAVVAFDGSAASSRATRMFAMLLLPGEGPAPVMLVSACDHPEEREAELADVAAYLEAHGARVTISVRHGHAAEVIETAADEVKPCLIVLGTLGHTKLAEVLLGSTSARLIKHARHPLFISS